MGEWFGQMLSIVLTALGLVSTPDATALGLAIAVVAVAVLALAITLSALPTGGGGSPHPRRAIDIGTLLTQSDPDAAGHPRPRAPGVVPAA
ncbi:DUF6412 domain-containing protein [Microbacterium sp. LTA6]|uniref:DUF6412 domain-containing protein n=1 Tax=unclassified Microbacterium TaxID=2609290 RepID=UPI00313A46A2